MHCLQIIELDYLYLEVTQTTHLKSEAEAGTIPRDVVVKETVELASEVTYAHVKLTAKLQKAKKQLVDLMKTLEVVAREQDYLNLEVASLKKKIGELSNRNIELLGAKVTLEIGKKYKDDYINNPTLLLGLHMSLLSAEVTEEIQAMSVDLRLQVTPKDANAANTDEVTADATTVETALDSEFPHFSVFVIE